MRYHVFVDGEVCFNINSYQLYCSEKLCTYRKHCVTKTFHANKCRNCTIHVPTYNKKICEMIFVLGSRCEIVFQFWAVKFVLIGVSHSLCTEKPLFQLRHLDEEAQKRVKRTCHVHGYYAFKDTSNTSPGKDSWLLNRIFDMMASTQLTSSVTRQLLAIFFEIICHACAQFVQGMDQSFVE